MMSTQGLSVLFFNFLWVHNYLGWKEKPFITLIPSFPGLCPRPVVSPVFLLDYNTWLLNLQTCRYNSANTLPQSWEGRPARGHFHQGSHSFQVVQESSFPQPNSTTSSLLNSFLCSAANTPLSGPLCQRFRVLENNATDRLSAREEEGAMSNGLAWLSPMGREVS